MRRRKFLRAGTVATGYGLASISSVDAASVPKNSQNTDATVLRSVSHLPLPDSPELKVPEGGQFLFVPISAPGKSASPEREYPSIDRYHLVIDNDQFAGSRRVGGARLADIMMWHSTLGRPYSSRIGEGIAVFEIPASMDTRRAVVDYRPDGGSAERVTELAEDTVESMTSAPSFVVESVDVPDTVTKGESAIASVRVRNDGSRDGVFRTIVGPASTPHKTTVTVPVPSGEQVTAGIGFEFPPRVPDQNIDASADSVTYVLDWGFGATENTIEVVDN